MKIVFLGLSITSSWGNGHATTYRGLIRELARRGHEVTFLERDVPWYAANRDLPQPDFCRLHLYASVDQLRDQHRDLIRDADSVIVGSYVPDGIAVGRWVIDQARGMAAFYDIDTPITLAGLESGDMAYIDHALIPRYDLYLSFTGGDILRRLEYVYGSPQALPLYCSVDPELYFPEMLPRRWDLNYMGTYSADRQPGLDALLIQPAREWPQGCFAVAGPQYPAEVRWPENVARIEHLPPSDHRAFYNSARFTLNLTREAMKQAGFAPSVRLFEAAACGTPMISDRWPGLETFFTPGSEILLADSAADVQRCLRGLNEAEREQIAERARRRVLDHHTAAVRAAELEQYLQQAGP